MSAAKSSAKKSPEVTPWFGRRTKPLRIGAWETIPEYGDQDTWFQYWNGQFWGCIEINAERSVLYRNEKSTYQSPKWRGLASDPSKVDK